MITDMFWYRPCLLTLISSSLSVEQRDFGSTQWLLLVSRAPACFKKRNVLSVCAGNLNCTQRSDMKRSYSDQFIFWVPFLVSLKQLCGGTFSQLNKADCIGGGWNVISARLELFARTGANKALTAKQRRFEIAFLPPVNRMLSSWYLIFCIPSASSSALWILCSVSAHSHTCIQACAKFCCFVM